MKRTKSARRSGIFLSALLLGAALSPAAFAAPKISVDGTVYARNILMQQDTTYIPMRDYLTFLGWRVEWDAAAGRASAQKGSSSISVSPAEQWICINERMLPASFPVMNGRIYLPLRALSTALGYTVLWDGTANTVFIRCKENDPPREDDLYWLSRIIYAEAGAEPISGQIAVGNVVLNRVTRSTM